MDSCLPLILSGLEQLGPEYRISEDRLAKLERYLAELLKWRQKVNLISKTAAVRDIIDKHFLDSLSLLPELQGNSRLLDIGTGAGFPGLVCRAALPQLDLCLLEPRLKRVNFLRHIIRTLTLAEDEGDICVYAERMDAESPLSKEKFTHVTCRAVTEIGPFLQMVSGFYGSGAALLLMKGPRWEEELAAAQPVLAQSGYRLGNVRSVILPFSGVEHFLLNFIETE